jgi:hypothetical protein
MKYFGLEVLTAVIMKCAVFWVVTLCSSVKPDVSEEHNASNFRAEG